MWCPAGTGCIGGFTTAVSHKSDDHCSGRANGSWNHPQHMMDRSHTIPPTASATTSDGSSVPVMGVTVSAGAVPEEERNDRDEQPRDLQHVEE